jgi:dihydrofolate reductase
MSHVIVDISMSVDGYVTDGLSSVVDKARAAAGDKDVVIMGGGATCHAFLEADSSTC